MPMTSFAKKREQKPAIGSTKAKKLISIKSPSKLGPDPNIVSTAEQHSCLCSAENMIFSKEPGKQNIPWQLYTCWEKNNEREREQSEPASSVLSCSWRIGTTGGDEIGRYETWFSAKWQRKLCSTSHNNNQPITKTISKLEKGPLQS